MRAAFGVCVCVCVCVQRASCCCNRPLTFAYLHSDAAFTCKEKGEVMQAVKPTLSIDEKQRAFFVKSTVKLNKYPAPLLLTHSHTLTYTQLASAKMPFEARSLGELSKKITSGM